MFERLTIRNSQCVRIGVRCATIFLHRVCVRKLGLLRPLAVRELHWIIDSYIVLRWIKKINIIFLWGKMRIVAIDIIITQLYSIALHNFQIIRKKFSNFPAGWGVISGRFSGEKFFSFGLPQTLSKSYFKNKTRKNKKK